MAQNYPPLFSELGVAPKTTYTTGDWKTYATHSPTKIHGFFGDFNFLSNISPSPITVDGLTYSCVECAYQAAKYPREVRPEFTYMSGVQAITFQRKFNLILPSNWANEKIELMASLLELKFANPTLAVKLLATHPAELVELNHWNDTFWGVNLQGVGTNHMGILLMQIRNNLY